MHLDSISPQPSISRLLCGNALLRLSLLDETQTNNYRRMAFVRCIIKEVEKRVRMGLDVDDEMWPKLVRKTT